jgi:hypothetical protein
MSFLRFALDGSPLDDTGFGLGESQDFVLDSSELDFVAYGLAPNAYAFESNGVASAPLGSLASTATSLPTAFVEASAPLGSSYSVANAIVSVSSAGDSQLGGLTAEAITNGTVTVSANSDFGSLTGHIQAVPQTEGGSFGLGLAFVQPNFVPEKDFVPEAVQVPSHIISFASSRFGRVRASATSQIDFSILEDDAEILLLA